MIPRAGGYNRSVVRALSVVLVVLLALLPVVPPRATAQAGRGTPVLAATLDNGLRVLLQEDHRSPIVTFQTWYRVGSRNEARGHTGLAHFLEHMMFKGTPTYGRGQFARLVEQNGGQDNAFTSQDVTSYYVNMVADKIDLVIDLEADRMQNILLDAKEIDSERQVVIEERRTRTEDDPGGLLGEEVGATAFRAHPYGQPIIGWNEDLRRITPEELRAFYKTYYVPNNALVVAVGAFKAPELLEKIKAKFGTIPRGTEPPPVTAVEPRQNGERRVVVRKQAQLPIVYIAYHVPNQRSDDAPALEVLSTILSSGRSSRLYRSLIYDRQLALDAGGDYSWFSFDPNLFWFWATAMPGQTPETLEKELLAEMAKLEKEPVTDVELQRVRNQIEAAFVYQEDSIHRRAALLARFELIGGYAQKDRYLERIRAVTAADVQRVARTYFKDQGKNLGVLLPLP
ncbi:MAG: insulinase family protein [Candidatus Rokubacteria bacterium]|nr:insulinase family protein [Candidatus Rokubacteria bacterium]